MDMTILNLSIELCVRSHHYRGVLGIEMIILAAYHWVVEHLPLLGSQIRQQVIEKSVSSSPKFATDDVSYLVKSCFERGCLLLRHLGYWDA